MHLSQPALYIALEGGFDYAGKAGFGVLHVSQLIGHGARLLVVQSLTFIFHAQLRRPQRTLKCDRDDLLLPKQK